MTLLALMLMLVCAPLLHWSPRRRIREVAAMGLTAGAVLALVSMVGAL